jgi:drug/metabolite transporter superfamily protein YnfA
MTETVLWLLALQGAIGAFDTLYFHEWRARLPARWPQTAPELRLHALRDFLYAVLFGSLPWLAWEGAWSFVVAAVLLAEITLTLADFVTEAAVRKPFGDVYAGERVTHALMGIVYGAMLASLIPTLWDWGSASTLLRPVTADGPAALRWLLTLMAGGVFVSGIRDMYAASGLPKGAWPWQGQEEKAANAV